MKDCRYGSSCSIKGCRFRHPRPLPDGSAPAPKDCKHWARGHCRNGDRCSSRHDQAKRPRAKAQSTAVSSSALTASNSTSCRTPSSGACGLVEVVLSFDTTGSMYSYLDTVREQLADLLDSLFDQIPNLRLGVIAHGDYCDALTSYVIKYLPLIQDRQRLLEFVREVGPTGGGNTPECYELALNKAQKEMHWSADATTRCLVMVGDATPHDKGYECLGKTVNIDWRNQLKALAQHDVMVYAVQCGSGDGSSWFWAELASQTKGQHLRLREIATLKELILALCLKQANNEHALDRHEQALKASGQMTRETAYVIEIIKMTRVLVRCSTTRATASKPIGRSHRLCPKFGRRCPKFGDACCH